MVARRPFGSRDVLLAVADTVWRGLGKSDWLEAFSRHPRIGESAAGLAAGEQAGMQSADGAVRAALAAVNRQYEARFGYRFLVCATGKSAAEMLELARRRLGNASEAELGIAAAEQQKITRLRLEKLLQ